MPLPLLFLHIAGGMVGLLSGTVAMVYRKGSRGHRMGREMPWRRTAPRVCGSALHWPRCFSPQRPATLAIGSRFDHTADRTPVRA